MKNHIYHTFGLMLIIVLVLFSLHWLPTIQISGNRLRKVDILSSIRPDILEDTIHIDSLLPPPQPIFIDTCKTGLTCIEDFSDSTQRGMKPFYEALANIDQLSRPARIAYFGDSFIEGDILTADLRCLLQQHFGGCGVGFVDITSNINGFRPTVTHLFDGWQSHSVSDSNYFDASKQGIAGRYFIPQAKETFVELRGNSKYAPNLDTCETSTLYYSSNGYNKISSSLNGKNPIFHVLSATGKVEACQTKGNIGQIRWQIVEKDSSLLCYGIAMDGKDGITVDNFSLRGSSGLSIRNIPAKHLKQLNVIRPYDLIILQFGLNVATPHGVKYDNYYKGMQKTIEHLKESFPQAGILIVGVGDRAYKTENGELCTMPGVKNLIRYQQRLAADANVAFWNMFLAMGGEGSMPALVNSSPAMANLDYTHINFHGGKHLANLLYETLIYGFEQYERKKRIEHLP